MCHPHSRTLVALSLLVMIQGLGFTYYIPATQLESSEVRGLLNKNRVEAGVLSGTILSDPTPSFALDEEGQTLPSTLPRAYFMPFVGVEIGLNEKSEVGARIHAISGLELRYKRQFVGFNEAQSAVGNISLSGLITGGLSFGTPPKPIYISTTHDEIATGSTLLYRFSIAVPAGYRFHPRHTALLTPHFSFGGLSNAGSLTGNANQIGIAVGWQFEIMDLVVRAETGYARGSFLNGTAGFFPFAASLGLKF